MNINNIIRCNLLLLYLCIFLGFIGCNENENQVVDYFKNAELQCEGRMQEENIVNALNDILSLSKEELKSKRYKDYIVKENQWDLPTLIYRHFIPDREGKFLGEKFYDDIKAKEVQEIIEKILQQIKNVE